VGAAAFADAAVLEAAPAAEVAPAIALIGEAITLSSLTFFAALKAALEFRNPSGPVWLAMVALPAVLLRPAGLLLRIAAAGMGRTFPRLGRRTGSIHNSGRAPGLRSEAVVLQSVHQLGKRLAQGVGHLGIRGPDCHAQFPGPFREMQFHSLLRRLPNLYRNVFQGRRCALRAGFGAQSRGRNIFNGLVVRRRGLVRRAWHGGLSKRPEACPGWRARAGARFRGVALFHWRDLSLKRSSLHNAGGSVLVRMAGVRIGLRLDLDRDGQVAGRRRCILRRGLNAGVPRRLGNRRRGIAIRRRKRATTY
jgi:hypothetical protein